MYQAIVFDLGNVLLEISFKRVCRYWADITGRDPQELYASFPRDEIFTGFEKGEISPEIFRRHVMTKMGCSMNTMEFDNGWNAIFVGPVPGIESVLVQLKKRYRLVGLSNTNPIHAAWWQAPYGALVARLERLFVSHEIGTRKPEPRAYEIVLDYLGLRPEEVIFIDDTEENVIASEQLGIKGLVMQTTPKLVRDLRELGIPITLPPDGEIFSKRSSA
ncbi:MAG TPA: HAD family phosphatase [Bacillota bacterium]